jgi:hypothetical protein
MNFYAESAMLCIPQDSDTLQLFKALQALLAFRNPTLYQDGRIGPETLAVTNRSGFDFETCTELANNIESVIIKLGAVVIDPVTKEKMVVDKTTGAVVAKLPPTKKAGFPWWMIIPLGALGYWMYAADKKRPKKDRWF